MRPLIALPTATWPGTRCSTVQYTRQGAPPRRFGHIGSTVATPDGHGTLIAPPASVNKPKVGCRNCADCRPSNNCPQNCKEKAIRDRLSAIYGSRGRGLLWSKGRRHNLWAAKPAHWADSEAFDWRTQPAAEKRDRGQMCGKLRTSCSPCIRGGVQYSAGMSGKPVTWSFRA